MNIFRDGIYWARRALMGLYGPADLDPEHDPNKQLEREHEAEVDAEEADDRPSTP